jgi:hypothetical protein
LRIRRKKEKEYVYMKDGEAGRNPEEDEVGRDGDAKEGAKGNEVSDK